MKVTVKNSIVKSSSLAWKPLVEKGILYQGVYVKSLKYDEKAKRSPSILLKFEAGASYPYHNHPGGEDIFVLKGSCKVNDEHMGAGDFLHTPVHCKHGVSSAKGCELLLNIPQEVEIL
ncbi:cupin domain-containing protein [Galbibacter sp. PAP.153]|uniref:cupin domain-containing protein n=1 Tax=Galbibacter sp. PAP.153 TaxID=3104623 RepID=UPI00300967B2